MERTFEDLREIAIKELDEINKRGEMDENSLVCAYKLIDIVKDIHEIDSMENGYSRTGRMSYPYNNGYSYRTRDSMGRYSRDYYRGYSRDNERDDLMNKMERMMDTAGSETERQVIQRIMSQM